MSVKYAVVSVAAANGTVRLCATSEPSQASRKSGSGAKRSLDHPEAIATSRNVSRIRPKTFQPLPRTTSRDRLNDSPADLPSITITGISIDQIVSRKRPGTIRRIRPIAIPMPARRPATIARPSARLHRAIGLHHLIGPRGRRARRARARRARPAPRSSRRRATRRRDQRPEGVRGGAVPAAVQRALRAGRAR